jgi:hypothetical protein
MDELLKAIDLALAGRWDESHKTVQSIEDPMAYWIHAVLHKIEGDLSNSRYWYTRAQKMKHLGQDATEELQVIRGAIKQARP